MIKTHTHVSFDLDGTLIDSIDLMQQSWKYATSILGINIRFSEYRKYIGIPFKEIVKKLDLESDYDDLYKLYFEYSEKNYNLVKLNAEILSVLEFLKTNHIGWSIITSKPRRVTLKILKHFNISPDYVICSDDVINGKPNNEPMVRLKELAKLDCNSKIYYVGDMLSDLQFAVESDVIYIHYTKGIGDELSGMIMNKFYQIDELSSIEEVI